MTACTENTLGASAARIVRNLVARTGCEVGEAVAGVASSLGMSDRAVLLALTIYPEPKS